MNRSINPNREPGKLYAGAAMLIIGSIFLVRNFGLDIPYWVLSWPMLLIAIGIVNGLKHDFKKPAAFIMIAIGALFLLKKIFFISISLFPLLLIAAGLWIIFRKQRHTVYEKF